MERYCDREDWIASYLDRTLPEAEHRELEEHLATCDRCLAELIAAQTELREIEGEAGDVNRFRRTTRNERFRELETLFDRFMPLMRLGKSIMTGVVLSSFAAITAAAFFLIAMQSYRFDPSYREGMFLLGRLLEVRKVGKLMLAGEGIQPVAQRGRYRGNGMLHLDLSLKTDERLERALARHPDNARILNALGHFHMADGQPEMAGIYFERALLVQPDDARSLNNLATAAYRRGDIAVAEKLLLQAEHHEDPLPECFYNLGVLYGEMGRTGLQRVHLEKFLEMAPDSPRADEARRILGIETTDR
jgi:tetratricopeptide (TPR) repeat protein